VDLQNTFTDTVNGSTDLVDANKTSYSIHGFDGSNNEDDEGFIKLRTILDAAERSILDFQNDIHVTNVYEGLREANMSSDRTKSWLRPNGRFEDGFWEDWSLKQNQREFRPATYSGTPRTSVWTPSFYQNNQPRHLKHRHSKKKPSHRKKEKSDRKHGFKHYGRFN